MIVLARLTVLVVLLASCAPSPGRERQGDEAYGLEDYEQALEHYQAAARAEPTGRVWAKAGAAALQAGRPRDAIDAYRQLVAADPTRAVEAADGLELGAQAAQRAGDAVALRDAVAALRAIAPDRPIGRYALTLVSQAGLDRDERTALIPAALAAADQPATVDSLLGAYGELLRADGACTEAASAYRSALRRNRDSAPPPAIRAGLAVCALEFGTRALDAYELLVAERWFAEAARLDSSSAVGRQALVGVGDARVRQGDTAWAAEAFRAAIALTVEPDSISRRAAARLEALHAVPTADDLVPNVVPDAFAPTDRP